MTEATKVKAAMCPYCQEAQLHFAEVDAALIESRAVPNEEGLLPWDESLRLPVPWLLSAHPLRARSGGRVAMSTVYGDSPGQPRC